MNKFGKILLEKFSMSNIENDVTNAINKCIENFNFAEVKEVFDKMNYKWFDVQTSEGYIPDIFSMKIKCLNMFYEAFAKLIVKNMDDYYISSGRFKVTVSRRKISDTYKYYAELEFVPISSNSY